MDTMNNTFTDSQAITFYEEMVDSVTNYGLSILSDREERLMFKKGRNLVDDVIKQVSKKNGTKLEFYNNNERQFIALSYNKGMNRQEIVKGFISQFGSHHTEASIGQKVEMCKAVDQQQSTHKKFQFRDDEMINILQEIDPNRYILK